MSPYLSKTTNWLKPKPFTRRTLLSGAGALGVTGLGATLLGLTTFDVIAQSKSGPAEVPIADLMKPGTLPEMTLGKADAKVTIVEYASMTCGHCARFHTDTFPELKKKYIDTNKVYFVMREFPLDNRATAGSMLGRCTGDDKAFDLVSILFERQADWAFVREKPVDALFALAKQVGFTREKFDACLKRQDLLDAITATRTRAADVFGVTSTPTFFINGKRLKGGQLADFEKMIDPLLAEAN